MQAPPLRLRRFRLTGARPPLSLRDISPHCGESPFTNRNKKTLEFYYKKQKEKELCKDLLQTNEQVSDTNSSEITIIPA